MVAFGSYMVNFLEYKGNKYQGEIFIDALA